MTYTNAQRAKIIEQMLNRTIADMEWDAEDRYWTITFTDGFEFSFRLMAELVGPEQPVPREAP